MVFLTSTARKQTGLTLVEVLIAVTIGLLILAALVGIFIANSRNYKQNDALATMQDSARFALEQVSRDLEMAGYYGGVRAVDSDLLMYVSASAAQAVFDNDCGPSGSGRPAEWLFTLEKPIEFFNHLRTENISTLFRCITARQANTDVVMIRRVAAQPSRVTLANATGSVAITTGRYFVKTNESVGSVYREPTGGINFNQPADCNNNDSGPTICPPGDPAMNFHAYTPRIYFIRNYLRTAGDKLPTLCRIILNDTGATPSMTEECLAEGVENLQIGWGIDSDNDQLVDYYTGAPSDTEIRQAIIARIFVMVRSVVKGVQTGSDTKTISGMVDYNSADDPDYVATDVIRRVYSTTVQLKNLRPS